MKYSIPKRGSTYDMELSSFSVIISALTNNKTSIDESFGENACNGISD